jgi:hypothetical protein
MTLATSFCGLATLARSFVLYEPYDVRQKELFETVAARQQVSVAGDTRAIAGNINVGVVR